MLTYNEPSGIVRERIHEITCPFLPESFMTWLIAKPCLGDNLRRKTIAEELGSIVTMLLAGLGLGFGYPYLIGGYLNLLAYFLAAICVLSSLRVLRLTVEHACSHNAVFKKSSWNKALGVFISILTLTVPFSEYAKRHRLTHHNPSHLLRPGDETYEYLFTKAGFKREMDVDQAYKHLVMLIFSPVFHYRQIISRLKSTFFAVSLAHRLLAWSFWVSVLGLVTASHTWASFFWVCLLPLTIFFEVSSLLRQCVEHRFSNSPDEMTSAIFVCDEPPILSDTDSQGIKFWITTKWWLRLFFYHLPVRLLVLTGDSPVHDYHHKHPGSDWVNAHLDRQADLEAGGQYFCSWGLFNAIKKTFGSFYLE